MADKNSTNFADLPKERVQEIASMGGKASHKNDDKPHSSESAENEENENNGRRADGTFLPNSEAAKEAGHKGGLHAHGEKTVDELNDEGRNEDGTFKAGSQAAKIAGHKGGVAAGADK